jgi:hypothetical protein
MIKCRECAQYNHTRTKRCKFCRSVMPDMLSERVQGKTLEQLATWYTGKRYRSSGKVDGPVKAD